MYRLGLGPLLGDRFLRLTHIGRNSGRPHESVLEVVKKDPVRNIYFVASGWGTRSDWFRNVMAHPMVKIQVGGHPYDAIATRVSPAEGEEVLSDYASRHPFALRQLSRIMGYPLGDGEASVRELGRILPIVAFQGITSAWLGLRNQPTF
jgi:deazaflavin-dependent oxidoreductase (nitroreductase family)